MIKKIVGILIVGLLMLSTVSIIAQKPEITENQVITQTNKISVKTMDSTYAHPVENKKIFTQPSGTLSLSLFPGATPAISNSGASMAIGFNSLDNQNVYFAGSTDRGTTWTDGIGWELDESPELPDVDGCGDGRLIGTMLPNGLDADGSAMYKVYISDASDTTNGYACSSWTWNDVGAGYTNFIDIACAGYTSAVPAENTWTYGAHAMVGDHGTAGKQTIFFSYQSKEEGNAWIYRFQDEPGAFNGATSASVDIDQTTLYSYAAYNYINYNNSGYLDIYLFIMDFGTWNTTTDPPQHGNQWDVYLNTVGNNNNLDISVSNNNVIIVSEKNGNIVAYHADDPVHNGTFSETTIITGAKQPRISHYGVNQAVCEYIKNGDVYCVVTDDGGATWSAPEKVSVEDSIQSTDVCLMGSAYESDNTIYFAPMTVKTPILGIESVSGGIGVSAVIKNSGTGAAENVDWSITSTGTIFVGKEKSGTIATLAPGASITIKSGLMLGFGTISTTITVGSVTKKESGKLLLFYVTGLA
ncbi:Uncharacterised protein [uncultured archaeon]|nr:Uncharacterised protein [uncultured archaeon]